tara:strand:- start:2009 stop:2308 length:300 start_codon:yes stop_codon:yes gene_type:complete
LECFEQRKKSEMDNAFEEKLGVKLAQNIEEIEDIIGRLVQLGIIETGEEYEPIVPELLKDFNGGLVKIFEAGQQVENMNFTAGLENYEGLDTFRSKNLL